MPAMPARFLLAAVMGWPVMHSRSPLLHNYWFRQHGLAGTYVPLAIEPGRLGDALHALRPLGFAGCNLTIPHKQAAMSIVDEVDAVARRIGAISCVTVRDDGSLAGSNNDGYGFIQHLRQSCPCWRADAAAAVVLGAGGGARAVCDALMQEGVSEIRVINRTLERAQHLAADFGSPLLALPWRERNDALAGAGIIVNTTSQGMVGQEPLDIRLDAAPSSALAYDIIYVPLETPFLAVARQRGLATLNGLGMLLHQGRPAWKSWFGIETAVTDELRTLLEDSLK
ncbi:MAG: shikimate dehydrogenase [Burkholderiaceae bacterium]|jgi:shikimate dehydrogenase|nr:shikimate dehydrogenase [Burkholderiaceae bacterium]